MPVLGYFIEGISCYICFCFVLIQRDQSILFQLHQSFLLPPSFQVFLILFAIFSIAGELQSQKLLSNSYTQRICTSY